MSNEQTNEIAMKTDTPRTDALMLPNGTLATNLLEHARQLERELIELWSRFDRQMQAEAEVERFKDLLNKTIAEIEKVPFHSPKLTAFTAHKLAEKYREQLNLTEK